MLSTFYFKICLLYVIGLPHPNIEPLRAYWVEGENAWNGHGIPVIYQ